MRRRRAFTLVEMLAVVTIMLILLGVAYGVFTGLAQQTGPEAALITIQAAVNNARDYAASHGVYTRIVFRGKQPRTGEPLESSTMTLQYLPPGESRREDNFVDIPGRQTVRLPRGIFVCLGFPTSLTMPPTVADPTQITQEQIKAWEKYEADLLEDVGRFALSGGKLKSEHEEFYIEFGPAGYPPAHPITKSHLATEEGGVTVVRISANRVVGYAFYPLNTNAGTRLIFE